MSGQVSQSTSKGLALEETTYFNKWLAENTSDPYPSRREKNEAARELLKSVVGGGDDDTIALARKAAFAFLESDDA